MALVYMSTVEEASLVKLSWLQWFLGFFVKQLPPIARLLILFNLVQSLLMLFQTWVPESIIKFQPDCNDVPQLRFLSIFLAAVMFCLLMIGQVTRAFNSSMEVYIEVTAEDIPACKKIRTHRAFFTFVAVDQNGKPVEIPQVVPETPEEIELFEGALRRRQLRLVLAQRMKPEDAEELRSIFNLENK